MGNIHISLFGCMRIFEGSGNEIKLPRKVSGLLSYLLLQRHRTHSRDVLAGLFWGDQSQSRARDCLNTALWRLRQVLEPAGVPAGTYLLGSYSENVGFNQDSAYWLDIAEFEERANQLLSSPAETWQPAAIENLENSLTLYTGDLLESYYDDWALYERERLRGIYLDCLIYLLQYYRIHTDHEKGIRIGHKILQLDPLREEIHRGLMEMYAVTGQRMAALKQYRTCCRVLKEELDIWPMEETQALYSQIQTGAQELKTKPANIIELLEQLQRVKGVIVNLETQVQQIIQMVERPYQ